MQKKSEAYERLNKIIQADKAVMSEACKTLVLQDFAEKFNEYFELIGLPRMEISCKNGKKDGKGYLTKPEKCYTIYTSIK